MSVTEDYVKHPKNNLTMILSIFRKEAFYNISADAKKNIGILLVLFISIIGLTIFQDFLESNRSGYAFYFSESILFKTIWMLFIPILALLKMALQNKNFNSFGKSTLLVVTSIIVHLILLSFVFSFISVLFYAGRYDIYKILSYTLANDLYKLVLIYSIFVFGYRYFSYKIIEPVSLTDKSWLKKIIIANGINNTIVEVSDIYQISAATPYISIEVAGKKHLHTETLKSISSQLNKERFVRVHKSTIVNLDKVISYKSRLNGDYDIFLENNATIRLSRTYVADFKSKFKIVHQVSS